jgi:hypothetical protein
VIHNEIEMGFTIKTESESDYILNVTVYTILGTDTKTGEILWQKDQNGCGGIPTTLLSEAEIFMEGDIKWDGCSNWTFDPTHGLPIHFCGPNDMEPILNLWRWIYKYAESNIPNWDAT